VKVNMPLGTYKTKFLMEGNSQFLYTCREREAYYLKEFVSIKMPIP
jgi:hypothetical protein